MATALRDPVAEEPGREALIWTAKCRSLRRSSAESADCSARISLLSETCLSEVTMQQQRRDKDAKAYSGPMALSMTDNYCGSRQTSPIDCYQPSTHRLVYLTPESICGMEYPFTPNHQTTWMPSMASAGGIQTTKGPKSLRHAALVPEVWSLSFPF